MNCYRHQEGRKHNNRLVSLSVLGVMSAKRSPPALVSGSIDYILVYIKVRK